jgi:hypothetical protein
MPGMPTALFTLKLWRRQISITGLFRTIWSLKTPEQNTSFLKKWGYQCPQKYRQHFSVFWLPGI